MSNGTTYYWRNLADGGHITLAGAQVEGMTLEEVKQELINRINEYFSEITN